jgi:adenylate kinase family enzyme
VIGPPASGKKTLSNLLAKKTGAILLTKKNIIESTPNQIKLELAKEISKNVNKMIFTLKNITRNFMDSYI